MSQHIANFFIGKFKFIWIWILIFLMGSPLLFSQFQVNIDTTQIRIGEQIRLEISTEQTKKVLFTPLKLDSLRKIEVVKEFPIDTLKNRLYKKYLLTSFDSGSYVLPSQEIYIENQVYKTDSLFINVATVAVDTTKQRMYPIKPIYKAPPKTWHEYLYILWWVIGLLLLAVTIWWILKRSNKRFFSKTKVVLTPFEFAINQLKALDEKDFIRQQKIKEYYSELTEIVRNYIEQDMRISAMEVTTEELINLLKHQNKYKKLGLSKQQINHLQLFLQNADLVKFAKAKPDEERINDDRYFAENVLKDFSLVVSKPELDEQGNPIIEKSNEISKTEIAGKKRRQKIILGIITLLVIISTLFWHFGFRNLKDSLFGHPTKELLDGKWYRNSYGYPSVNINSPVVLKAVEMPLSIELSQLLQSNSNFVYGNLADGFYMFINTTEYGEQMTFNKEQAVQAAISMINSQPEVSNFQHEIKDVSKEGILGKSIKGNLKIKGKTATYQQFIFYQNEALQQIAIIRWSDDIYAEQIEKNIFESLKLENTSK